MGKMSTTQPKGKGKKQKQGANPEGHRGSRFPHEVVTTIARVYDRARLAGTHPGRDRPAKFPEGFCSRDLAFDKNLPPHALYPANPITLMDGFIAQLRRCNLRVRDLIDKSVNVAAGLGKCGLENQESLISHLGHIATHCGQIRDECFVCKTLITTYCNLMWGFASSTFYIESLTTYNQLETKKH